MPTDPRDTAEHHITIDARRWRASDPAIPDALRQELVNELMAARRAVGAATRSDDDESSAEMQGARARVQDAKVALGERGAEWWEPVTDDDLRARLAAAMRTLLRHRARGPLRIAATSL